MGIKFEEKDMPFVQKAETYCAADEQCRSAVRAKLLVWGASRTLIDDIIKHLVDNDFINEQRYTRQYCDSKLRLQKWGRIKISYQLRAKQIPKNIIEKSISEIDGEVYGKVLFDLAENKWATLQNEANSLKRKNKLVTFLASKGFEMDEILEAIEPIINPQPQE